VPICKIKISHLTKSLLWSPWTQKVVTACPSRGTLSMRWNCHTQKHN